MGDAAGNDAPLTRRQVGIALLAALCFLAPALLLAGLAGPELPTLGGALIGGAIFAWLLRRGIFRQRRAMRGVWPIWHPIC